MTSPKLDALVERVRQLAESGDYAGFNAVLGALRNEFDWAELDVAKRAPEFRRDVADICHEAWQRKHAR